MARLVLASAALLLPWTAQPTHAISLFMRTTWLAELPEAEWRAWFELVKRGRQEGKTSPYYVEEVSACTTLQQPVTLPSLPSACAAHPTSAEQTIAPRGSRTATACICQTVETQFWFVEDMATRPLIAHAHSGSIACHAAQTLCRVSLHACMHATLLSQLALQNTACCESHPDKNGYKALGCLGPKCSDLGLEPYTLLTAQLDQMSEYFPLFDRVWVGTTTSQEWDRENASR
jgi:hypothetical protein